MGLFRRSQSSSSTRSSTSSTGFTTDSSTSLEFSSSSRDGSSPRSSIDSDYYTNIADSIATVTQRHPQQKKPAPFHTLPVELIQQISSYLDDASAASFCLSSRFVCYAVGMNHLLRYLGASKSRFEKRRMIESVVERAFPQHWFCAWCDKFHRWTADYGPAATSIERQRDCAEFNSYLYDNPDYVIYFHHIRLAVNQALWGPEHGIPLSKFAHTRMSMVKIVKTFVPAKLTCEAKVVNGRFLLHSTYTIDLPAWAMSNKHMLRHLWPTLPHILVGHRDSENGHTGLMAAIDNVVRRGWKYPFTQMCSTCATDWSVDASGFLPSSSSSHTPPKSPVKLKIQTWRDLGDGRNPFEISWRAHGVATYSNSNVPTDILRLTQARAGDIRRAFEVPDEAVMKAIQARERARESERRRIYRSFMRRRTSSRDGNEAGDDGGVRRSRAARPGSGWRTRSSEVVSGEEERFGLARNVVGNLMGMDGERGRRL